MTTRFQYPLQDTATPVPHSLANDPLQDAELLEPTGGERLHLRFPGPFEGKPVIWDTTIVTLAHWQAEHPSNRPLRNFIDIGAEGDHGIVLTIGLDIPCLDLPTIRKAIVMVRQYKRLARGRHEFGPPVRSPSSG